MCQILKEIYQTEYGPLDHLKMANLQELVTTLNNIAKPEKLWTKNFLHSLIKGYDGFTFSSQLKGACEIYAGELDGQSFWQARMRDETIRVFNGTKAHRAWLDPNAKILTCARPECNIKFIKTWPGMKYCPKDRVK